MNADEMRKQLGKLASELRILCDLIPNPVVRELVRNVMERNIELLAAIVEELHNGREKKG